MGSLTAIPATFEEAVEEDWFSADLLVVGVDSNACRLAAVRFARQKRIPAVFTMLSLDGMRCQCFLQGPNDSSACLWCALPNLDPEKSTPCAASIISSCLVAGAHAMFFVHRALMGWPEGVEPFNWREVDLLAMAPDRTGQVKWRSGCPICSRS